MTDLRLFAFAAAKRYSGTYRVKGLFENEPQRLLPAVRYWLAWNEPNNPVFLKPQWKMVNRKGGARRARSTTPRSAGSIWTGVHSTRIRNEKVACGVTGPRGNDAPRSSRPSTSPLVFLTWLRRAGLKRFDAYAHHPYYGSRFERPNSVPRSKKSVTLGNIGVLIQQLHPALRPRQAPLDHGVRLSDPAPRPPVRRSATRRRRSTFTRRSRERGRQRRIDMLVWFLLRDERRLTGWQSGVISVKR